MNPLQSAQRRYDAMQDPDYYEPSTFRCVICGEKRHMSERVEGKAFCESCDEEAGFRETCRVMNEP